MAGDRDAVAAAARRTSPPALARALRGDLDTIVATALRKEPERRYASVERLAEDVALFRAGRPIRARPESLAYRARKFAGRHRFGVAAAGLIALLLTGFSIFAWRQAAVLAVERDAARAERDKARELSEFLTDLFGADPYADDPGRRPYFDGWESFNEPVAGNIDEMARLGEFEAERTRLLGDRGIRSVIGNFGTGQPPLEQWPAFLPAIQAAIQYGGWLGLHEYSAPTMYYLSTVEGMGRYPGVTPQDSGWLTLRYRKVYNEILAPAGLTLPLVMTELGVDGLVQNRPGPPDARGWQDFQGYWAENGYGLWGPGAYVEQLVWYDNAMRQDDYVIGGTIFALTPTAGWESYDIHGPVAGVLQQYLSVHAPA